MWESINKLADEIFKEAVKSKSQKGDLSKALKNQGFFDYGKGISKRDPFLSGGNPVDTQKDFFKQNPK